MATPDAVPEPAPSVSDAGHAHPNMTTAPETVLLMGGTGNVGSRLAKLLQAAHVPCLVASRSGTVPEVDKADTQAGGPLDGVAFDWFDRRTYERPFEAARTPVLAVYITSPPVVDALPLIADFVDVARAQGVRRFVLLSASSVEPGPGSPAGIGRVHAYLQELAETTAEDGGGGEDGDEPMEWAVLRPSWFQQNFSQQPNHRNSIREEGKIYSATGDGKIPFVSADDIAAVAFQALTSKDAPNKEFLILGPELLSYGDVAAILTEVIGRKIVHADIPAAELEARYRAMGLPEDYAKMLSAMDTDIKHGSEERTNDVVLAVTGRAPRPFREYAEANKAAWL